MTWRKGESGNITGNTASLVHGVGSFNSNYKHGLVNSSEWSIWADMRRRCKNNYDYYSRNITVYSEWSGKNGFLNFYNYLISTIGLRPDEKSGSRSTYSLDRIDNDKGYEPGNIRWTSSVIQANNRRKRNNAYITYAYSINQSYSTTRKWVMSKNYYGA